MSWESRGGSQRYLYVVRREGQKLRKVYVGKGFGAYLVAKEIEEQAEKRREAFRELREFEAQLWHLDHSMRITREAARQALQAAYFMAGYQQTRCFHWTRGVTVGKKKKRRRKTMPNPRKKKEPGASDPVGGDKSDKPAEPVANTEDNKSSNQKPLCIADTLRAMKAGRTDLLGHLRGQLSQVPELWKKIGDITRLSIEGWARQISSGDILLRESIVLCALEERAELVTENATSMEHVIADRLVLARLQREFYELFAANTASDLLGGKLGEVVEKRLKSANFEFAQAARHLAKIRELQTEATPNRPVESATLALKVYDPGEMKRSA